jgi:hypothetical protein
MIRPRKLCRVLFNRLRDLVSFIRMHIFILNIFVNNQECFWTNSLVHSVNRRNKHHLHEAITSPPCCQKSQYYAAINIFFQSPKSYEGKAQFKIVQTYSKIHTNFTLLINSYDLNMVYISNINGKYCCILYMNCFVFHILIVM